MANTVIGGTGCQSKHKAHRGRIKQGYYKAQFHRTERNKAARKARINRRKKMYPQKQTAATEA